jgi:hypothetical protein
MGKMGNVYKILVGKQTPERLFWSPEHRPGGNYNAFKGTSCRGVKSGLNWHITASNDGTVRVINLTTSVGIATGYGLDDQGEREFESR